MTFMCLIYVVATCVCPHVHLPGSFSVLHLGALCFHLTQLPQPLVAGLALILVFKMPQCSCHVTDTFAAGGVLDGDCFSPAPGICCSR